MLSEDEHSYRRENGPFSEHGWYEGEPGYWHPGRPFIEEYNAYINSIEGTEAQQEMRKLMRELINEEI